MAFLIYKPRAYLWGFPVGKRKGASTASLPAAFYHFVSDGCGRRAWADAEFVDRGDTNRQEYKNTRIYCLMTHLSGGFGVQQKRK